jgi:hypothetical protein
MISIYRDPQIRQVDPKNHFSAVAGGAYDPSVVTGMPAWREVQLLVARELGEPVSGAGPLVPARRSGMTWAARAQRTGAIVVKVRHSDRAYEKTQWCAAHLPALGARGIVVALVEREPRHGPSIGRSGCQPLRQERRLTEPGRS